MVIRSGHASRNVRVYEIVPSIVRDQAVTRSEIHALLPFSLDCFRRSFLTILDHCRHRRSTFRLSFGSEERCSGLTSVTPTFRVRSLSSLGLRQDRRSGVVACAARRQNAGCKRPSETTSVFSLSRRI